MNYASQVKETLLNDISDMAELPGSFQQIHIPILKSAETGLFFPITPLYLYGRWNIET